jgi:hypothetical protein
VDTSPKCQNLPLEGADNYTARAHEVTGLWFHQAIYILFRYIYGVNIFLPVFFLISRKSAISGPTENLRQSRVNRKDVNSFKSEDNNRHSLCCEQEITIFTTQCKDENDMDSSDHDSGPMSVEPDISQSSGPIRIEEQSSQSTNQFSSCQSAAHAQTALHLPDLRTKVRRLEPKERDIP